ncbi:MAG: D-alanyl-D-alanine dipeptidase [Proteobacteria bacterium]|nr:D-alanyl-D-alanine dipeptidase [Pseudomonadota bacterium]
MTPSAAGLVEITSQAFGVEIDLLYAGARNFTGRPVYRRASCFLHADAAAALARAVRLAAPLGYRLKLFDAFRPAEAQWVLWRHAPNPDFLVHPARGSPHSRAVAVDVTLLDPAGDELDMGTPVDSMSPESRHGTSEIRPEAQRNRLVLLGLMSAAGWDFYRNEWWHYQLFDARRYPLLSGSVVPGGP